MKIRNPRLIAAAGWLGTRLVAAALRHRSASTTAPSAASPSIHFSRPRPVRSSTRSGTRTSSSRSCGSATPASRPSSAATPTASCSARSFAPPAWGSCAVRPIAAGWRRCANFSATDVAARHLAVTPDGPRGPRRVVQPGVVYLASRTGMRIVPIGVGHRRPWRMKSWDSFRDPAAVLAGPLPVRRAARSFRPILRRDSLAPHVERLQPNSIGSPRGRATGPTTGGSSPARASDRAGSYNIPRECSRFRGWHRGSRG